MVHTCASIFPFYKRYIEFSWNIYIYSNVGEMESDFPDEVYWNMRKSVEGEVDWKDGLSRGLSGIYIYIYIGVCDQCRGKFFTEKPQGRGPIDNERVR